MANSLPTTDPAQNAALCALSERLQQRPLRVLRSAASHQGALAEAAVLVPLRWPSLNEAPSVWLLKRPSSMRTHAGQLAFPGGRVDPRDRDHAAAALREAEEEIGLPPAAVQLLGPLDSLITPSGFCVRPLVGLVPATFTPQPNPAEVELVLRAPLAEFLRPLAGTSPQLGLPLGEHSVWGATFWIAKFLAELAREPLQLRAP